MPWRGPEYEGDFPSLGWDLVDLIEGTLRVPAGPLAGQPVKLGDWQLDALVRLYAVHPVTCRPVYDRLVMELMKGVGKSPTAAFFVFCELVGPVEFDGWDAAGEPVGRPRNVPWIQIGAMAEDSTENTYTPFRQMLSESRAIDDFGIDMGLTRVFTKSGGKVEPVTASSGAREGQPITAAVLDETALWTKSTGGTKLAEVLRGNVAKNGGRTVETTNAFEPGRGSVAEQSAAASKRDRRILYVHWAAPDVKDPKDPAELRSALEEAYRPAPWAPVDAIFDHCMAPDTDPLRVRRVFLNHRVASEARFVPEPDLRRAVQVDEVELEDGAPLAVGFDGSERRDATSIIGVHMVSGRAYVLGHWERQLHHQREWEVPRHEVVATLEAVFDRWDVARLKFDPAKWRDELALVQQQFGKDRVDRFPVNTVTVVHEAIEAAQEGFRAGTVTVDGGPDSAALVRHLEAAMLSFTETRSRRLKLLVKPDDGRRIDAAAALVYAVQARAEAQQRGWRPSEPSTPFVLFGGS